MKVKMFVAVNGVVNGTPMGPYAAGQEYDLDDAQAQLFIGSAMAEVPAPPVEDDADSPAPTEVVVRPRTRLFGSK